VAPARGRPQVAVARARSPEVVAAQPTAPGGPRPKPGTAATKPSVRHPVNPLALQAGRARGLRRCLAQAAHRAKRRRNRARRNCLKRYARSPGLVTRVHARSRSGTPVVLSFPASGSDGPNPPAARVYLIKQSTRPIRGARDFRRA